MTNKQAQALFARYVSLHSNSITIPNSEEGKVLKALFTLGYTIKQVEYLPYMQQVCFSIEKQV